MLQIPKPRRIVHASRGRKLTSMLDFHLLPMVPRVLLLLFFASPLPLPRHRWPSSCRNSVTSLLTSHSHDSIHDCTQAQHNYSSNAKEKSALISSTNKELYKTERSEHFHKCRGTTRGTPLSQACLDSKTQIFYLSASVKQKQSTNKSALQNKSQPEAQSSRTIKVTAKNFNKGFKVASLLFSSTKSSFLLQRPRTATKLH